MQVPDNRPLVGHSVPHAGEELFPSSGLTIADLQSFLRRHRLRIAVAVVVSLTTAFLYVFTATPIYRSSVEVAPNPERTRGGTSGGFLQGLIGSSTDANQTLDSTDVVFERLTSKEVARVFTNESGIKPHLFPQRWNAEQEVWQSAPAGLLDRLFGWTGLVGNSEESGTAEPGFEETYRALDRISDFARAETDIVTISFSWRDPALAASWANQYVRTFNDLARAREHSSLESRIAYLERQIERETQMQSRSLLIAALGRALNSRMLVDIDEQFYYQVIDPALPLRQKEWPKPVPILLAALFAGVVLGALIGLWSEWRRR